MKLFRLLSTLRKSRLRLLPLLRLLLLRSPLPLLKSPLPPLRLPQPRPLKLRSLLLLRPLRLRSLLPLRLLRPRTPLLLSDYKTYKTINYVSLIEKSRIVISKP